MKNKEEEEKKKKEKEYKVPAWYDCFGHSVTLYGSILTAVVFILTKTGWNLVTIFEKSIIGVMILLNLIQYILFHLKKNRAMVVVGTIFLSLVISYSSFIGIKNAYQYLYVKIDVSNSEATRNPEEEKEGQSKKATKKDQPHNNKTRAKPRVKYAIRNSRYAA